MFHLISFLKLKNNNKKKICWVVGNYNGQGSGVLVYCSNNKEIKQDSNKYQYIRCALHSNNNSREKLKVWKPKQSMKSKSAIINLRNNLKGTLASYLVQSLALNSTHLLAQCLRHSLFMKTSKRFHNTLGQTVSVFDQPHCDLFIFLKSNRNFYWYNCVYCPLSFHCAPVEASSVFSITIYLTVKDICKTLP